MLGQETRDLSAMMVQQGYKSSFMVLYGHSRLDRPNKKFCSFFFFFFFFSVFIFYFVILFGLCAILSNAQVTHSRITLPVPLRIKSHG